MSATISHDLVDWTSFADIHRIEIFRDLLVLYYPKHAKFLRGERIHSFAPLLALDEPVPTTPGPVRAGLFPVKGTPTLTDAGDHPGSKLKFEQVPRPTHHPAGTPFFLLDGKNLKHLIRLTEFCRMGIDRKGRVCLVFNDLGYVIERGSGTIADLKAALIAQFPKSKTGSTAGEFSGMSVWEDTEYALPGLSQHFGVHSIEVVPPLSAVADSTWAWIGPLLIPRPHGGSDMGMSL